MLRRRCVRVAELMAEAEDRAMTAAMLPDCWLLLRPTWERIEAGRGPRSRQSSRIPEILLHHRCTAIEHASAYLAVVRQKQTGSIMRQGDE